MIKKKAILIMNWIINHKYRIIFTLAFYILLLFNLYFRSYLLGIITLVIVICGLFTLDHFEKL
ncbi:hypothetical protein IV81_GL000757 [Pediococcus stilesii]|uniref:Uncharacterized protein n=1 Tax=Pediococcus stilesii TaxID=331679 RepID=A0A0R2KZK2_9LACO|nr:hypothetical protein IV81_GL000757 [Pediococcus stilesii]